MAAQTGSRRKEHHEEHPDERWLITYADMITLLMVLFIVMFAISQVDQKKFAELSGGLSTAFGGEDAGMPGGAGVLPGDDSATGDATVGDVTVAPAIALGAAGNGGEGRGAAAAAADRARLAAARTALQRALEQAGLAQDASLEVDERGLVVTLVTDDVLFASGQAVLAATGQRVLDALGPVLRELPHRISVEGHTDDVPITGTYPSNWELSAARAASVLRHLVQQDGLSPARMSATGYADQKPLVPMTTDGNRTRNRRVEVVVHAQPASIAPDLGAGLAATGPAATTGLPAPATPVAADAPAATTTHEEAHP